ncbi:MAG: GcrA family cell cycle regulator [Martelella sp.]|uniref:GcrA family cell cycle regulator n=1 Tax=Martelella sp. TaxID=1969699 RepID=UPI0032427D14
MSWTDEMHAEAKALWAGDWRAVDICERLGCDAARFLERRLALPDDFPARSAGRADFCEAEIAVAAKAWGAGQSCAAIGALLDRSRNSIAALAQRRRALFPGRAELKPDVLADKAAVAAPAPKRTPGQGSARLAAVGINAVRADVKAPTHEYDFSDRKLAGVAPVPFAEAIVAGGCRFPVGDAAAPDGADMPCCGAKTLFGKAWCKAHYRVVYRPVKAVAA